MTIDSVIHYYVTDTNCFILFSVQFGRYDDGKKFLDFYAKTLADMDLKSDVQKYFDDKTFQIADGILQKPGQVCWN